MMWDNPEIYKRAKICARNGYAAGVLELVRQMTPKDAETFGKILSLSKEAQAERAEAGLAFLDHETAENRLADAIEEIDALANELVAAIDACFNHGAASWVQSNYPDEYKRLLLQEGRKKIAMKRLGAEFEAAIFDDLDSLYKAE
jgi:hypothetical protein